MKTKTITDYILTLFCGGGAHFVSYGEDPAAKIVIEPSGFFDVPRMPELPLSETDGIPLLFGTPEITEVNGQLRLKVDLVASAFFLLSRYEEVLRRDVRDPHGRFPGKESLPFRAGFIHRPIVDEYGLFLCNLLRKQGIVLPPEESGIRRLYLTHDVDMIWTERRFRTMVRKTLSYCKHHPLMVWKPFYDYLTGRDNICTFPWLLRHDAKIKSLSPDQIQSVYFVIAGGNSPADAPYYIRTEQGRKFVRELSENDVAAGLHVSYSAGGGESSPAEERKTLQDVIGKDVTSCRNHFLRLGEPEAMQTLEDAGLTDDFSLGYADVAGFRLGTCRPVRYINPVAGTIGKLVIHPLTIMECTLDRACYMGLDYEQALEYCKSLVIQTEKFAGECNLLWHNTTLTPPAKNQWQRKLYENISRFAAGKIGEK